MQTSTQLKVDEILRQSSQEEAKDMDEIPMLAAHLKKTHREEAMIGYLIDYVKTGDKETQEMKSMWVGCLYIKDADTQVCWINQTKMHKITKYAKTSISKYLGGLRFEKVTDQTSDREDLDELMGKYKVDKREGKWVKYERLPEIIIIFDE